MTYDKTEALTLLSLCSEAYILANTGHCTLPDGFSTPLPIRLNGKRPILLRGDNLDIVGFTSQSNGVTYIVFRGTQILKGVRFAEEWVLDGFCFPMVDMPGRGRVHLGFNDFYRCALSSLLSNLREYPLGMCDALMTTGHSLGAAAATICHAKLGGDLLTFGSPRVGNKDFAEGLWSGPTIRVTNKPDVVPDVPLDQWPLWMFRHGGENLVLDGPGAGQWHVAHSLESYRAGIELQVE
jgi:predicted lipase